MESKLKCVFINPTDVAKDSDSQQQPQVDVDGVPSIDVEGHIKDQQSAADTSINQSGQIAGEIQSNMNELIGPRWGTYLIAIGIFLAVVIAIIIRKMI